MTFIESINSLLDKKLCTCCLQDSSVVPWFREAPDVKLCEDAQEMCSECRANHPGMTKCKVCGEWFCSHEMGVYCERTDETYCSEDCEFEARPDGTRVPYGDRYVEVGRG